MCSAPLTTRALISIKVRRVDGKTKEAKEGQKWCLILWDMMYIICSISSKGRKTATSWNTGQHGITVSITEHLWKPSSILWGWDRSPVHKCQKLWLLERPLEADCRSSVTSLFWLYQIWGYMYRSGFGCVFSTNNTDFLQLTELHYPKIWQKLKTKAPGCEDTVPRQLTSVLK